MTHRDRAGDPSGQGAGRREAAGDPGSAGGFAGASAGHPPSAAAAPLLRRTGQHGFPTPSGGSPARSPWVITKDLGYNLPRPTGDTFFASSQDTDAPAPSSELVPGAVSLGQLKAFVRRAQGRPRPGSSVPGVGSFLSFDRQTRKRAEPHFGNVASTRKPPSTRLLRAMVPPWARIMFCATVRPSPVPPVSRERERSRR